MSWKIRIAAAAAGMRELSETIGARVVALMVSILLLMLSARWLGPEGRGAVATVTTWTTIASNLAALSLGQICVHQASTSPDRSWMAPATAALLFYTSVASILCWLILAGMIVLSNGSAVANLATPVILVGFAVIPLLIWEQFSSALITLSERLRWYNVTQVAGKLVALGLALLFVAVLKWRVVGFLTAVLVGQAISSGTAAFRLLRDVGKLPRPSMGRLGQMIAAGLKLHLNVVGVLLITGVDVLMLQYFRGLAETGLFQLSSQIFLTCLVVPQSAILLLNGKVGQLSPAAFWREQRRITYLVLALMVLAALALAGLAPIIVYVFASESFARSVPILQLLAVALPGATLNMMMGPQWLVRGWLWQASLVTLTAGVVNCLLNLLLIPRYGATGAATAAVAGIYTLPFCSNMLMFLRSQREWAQQVA